LGSTEPCQAQSDGECLLPAAAASLGAIITCLTNVQVSGPLLLACHVQRLPPERLSVTGTHLPNARGHDAVTRSQHKPGSGIGVCPPRASTAEPGAGLCEMAQSRRDDPGSWVALGRDKEKGGGRVAADWEEETEAQSILGCKFAPCTTQGGRKSPHQCAGGSVPWRGRSSSSTSVAGMLWAGHLSRKAALASAESCRLHV